jgi:hypothetical protein
MSGFQSSSSNPLNADKQGLKDENPENAISIFSTDYKK